LTAKHEHPHLLDQRYVPVEVLAMRALRLLALLAGPVALLAPPIMLSDAGTRDWSGPAVAAGVLGTAAVSATFIYVGVVGERMLRKEPQRLVGGLLLLIPMICGLILLASRKEAAQMIAGGIVLGFSLLLFLSFVFPAMEPRSRPLRRRDRQDPGGLQLRS
jgi:hypothetical protein